MRIIAAKDQVDALPGWARDFLSIGWTPPDENGQRAALKASAASFEEVARRFTAEMTRGLRDPAVCTQQYAFALRERDESMFRQMTLWKDGGFAAAADLAQAWNYGCSIAECMVCGNLMQPDKGRVARTCSPACRLALHRQRKET